MIISYDDIPKLIEFNYEMKINSERVLSAKIKYTSIVSSFIPEVYTYAKLEDHKLGSDFQRPSIGVVANLNLFNGFKDIKQEKINKLDYELSKLDYHKSYKHQVFVANKYFIEALGIKEKLSLLNEYKEINKKNKVLVLKKVTSGLSPKSEESLFKKIELIIKESQLKERGEQKIIHNNLKKMLSLKPEEELIISGNINQIKSEFNSHKKRLEFEFLELNELSATIDENKASLWRMPRINLYAEQSLTKKVNGEFLDTESHKQVFGIYLTIPLIDEFNTSSIELYQKSSEARFAKLNLQNQKLLQILDDENFKISMENLAQLIELSKEKVSLSNDIMEKTFSEFRLGLKDASDLNESSREYLEARQDLLQLQVNYILKIEEAHAGLID